MTCDKKNCLNCTLEKCIYDSNLDENEGKYKIVRGNCKGLGFRLKSKLFYMQISQKELARRTGISAQTICAYTNELRVPRADHIIAICKALECSSDWLLGMIE